jgi:hypothetical protein
MLKIFRSNTKSYIAININTAMPSTYFEIVVVIIEARCKRPDRMR